MDANFAIPLSNGLKAVAALVFLVLLTHVVPFLRDEHDVRSYPGPALAKLSDAWLAWCAACGKINRSIYEAHKAYGPIVRIAPNHISIADVSALQPIYGHGSGILKAEIYDTFVAFDTPSVFTTRSREEHARKRKVVSNAFAQKSVLEFEPVVKQYVGAVLKHWSHMCIAASSGDGGIIGDMKWTAQGGRATFNVIKWYNFMVFDIIGDLVFRAPFGMTEHGTDIARIAKNRDHAMASYDSGEVKLEYDTVNAVQALLSQNKFLTVVAQLPAYLRPLLQSVPLPWIRSGAEAFQKFSTLSVTAVANSQQYPAPRNDILGRYFEATDEKGQKMGNHELSSEAVSLLIAGTDTTSNSAAALTFYLAHNPAAQAKLQVELDKAFGPPCALDGDSEPAIVSYDQVKNLSYLHDVVNEGLRLFSAVGLGLPRVVPEGGLTVLGRKFAPGTVVSVPTHVVHHDKTIWGDDAESFNPDRWTEGDKTAMMEAFAPFSVGPTACIGRNLALMELLIVVANVFYYFDAAPTFSDQPMEIWDGFLRQAFKCDVSLKRRGVA